MREISIDEHKELMAFLSNKAKQLYAHEVEEAIRAGREPKNVYQSIFSRQQCFADEKDGIILYRVYTKGFLKFSREVLPEITKKDPNVFRNRDARDILEDLYNVSGYSVFHKTPNEYIKNILDEACVYVVLKTESGFDDKVLRVDLCRGVSPSIENSKKYVFRGGLLHAAKHYRIDDSAAVDSSFDLEHLVWLCSNAFLRILSDDKTKYTICLPYNNTHSIQFGFYKEKDSRVFYVNTIYPINNCTIESFSTNGKYGLRNQRGGVIVPSKYDNITYEEKSGFFICGRDGTFLEKNYNNTEKICINDIYWRPTYPRLSELIYTGVYDLYDEKGVCLIGGFDIFNYNAENKFISLFFGGQWRSICPQLLPVEYCSGIGKWLILNRKLETIKKFRVPEGVKCLNDIPQDILVEEYHRLNENQLLIRRGAFIEEYGEDYTLYNVWFATENILSSEYNWIYPIGESMSIVLNNRNKIGIITPDNSHIFSKEYERQTSRYEEDYDYISKPIKGWCIGVAHMQVKPYDDSIEKRGYCALINIYRYNHRPIILLKNLPYDKIERLVKYHVLGIIDIDEATSNLLNPTYLSISKELYEMGILEKLTFEVKCGPAVAELDKSLCQPFISAKEVIENKKKSYCAFSPT